jgi:hypothetical protein
MLSKNIGGLMVPHLYFWFSDPNFVVFYLSSLVGLVFADSHAWLVTKLT